MFYSAVRGRCTYISCLFCFSDCLWIIPKVLGVARFPAIVGQEVYWSKICYAGNKCEIWNFPQFMLLVYSFKLFKMYKVIIPNRTFLVCFGGISGEFGRAVVCILARRSLSKIPMARPNKTDMPLKRTKMVWLGIYRTQIRFILYAKRRKDDFHRVKMCQAFRSSMSMCDCLWFENELKMNCLRSEFPSSYLKCPLSFLLWRICRKNRPMLSFLNCFEDEFWDNRDRSSRRRNAFSAAAAFLARNLA